MYSAVALRQDYMFVTLLGPTSIHVKRELFFSQDASGTDEREAAAGPRSSSTCSRRVQTPFLVLRAERRYDPTPKSYGMTASARWLPVAPKRPRRNRVHVARVNGGHKSVSCKLGTG